MARHNLNESMHNTVNNVKAAGGVTKASTKWQSWRFQRRSTSRKGHVTRRSRIQGEKVALALSVIPQMIR